jgi:uncharacterized Zn finger protein (UPF0148 family)
MFVSEWIKKPQKSAVVWDSEPRPERPPAPDLDVIRHLDPDFSAVLFEDFVYALYARAYQARASQPELEALAPYLALGVRRALASSALAGGPVTAVVIGALRVRRIELPAPGAGAGKVRVTVEIEADLTTGVAGSEQTWYTREVWSLRRDSAARTRPPEAVRSFHCPNCGAPFASADGKRCDYCGEAVTGGRFDWSVEAIATESLESRPPALTGTVEEQGTGLSTVIQPGLDAHFAQLRSDDPSVTEHALAVRLRLIYEELNTAWTNLDLRPIRPYVSDNLYDYLQYWIRAYESQGLCNVLEEMRLTRTEIVKVVRDRWFDAVTFRIWGAGRDTTIRVATGELVGGRPDEDREYTEYWTLIRGAGVRGAARTDRACPNCGAALDVNQAGACEHCGAHVTRGEFDWVLSRIEQDDSYTG